MCIYCVYIYSVIQNSTKYSTSGLGITNIKGQFLIWRDHRGWRLCAQCVDMTTSPNPLPGARRACLIEAAHRARHRNMRRHLT